MSIFVGRGMFWKINRISSEETFLFLCHKCMYLNYLFYIDDSHINIYQKLYRNVWNSVMLVKIPKYFLKHLNFNFDIQTYEMLHINRRWGTGWMVKEQRQTGSGLTSLSTQQVLGPLCPLVTKLIVHLHIVPGWRIFGAISPLPLHLLAVKRKK
jgi:hypothetical protein